jgi:hypothetical protein
MLKSDATYPTIALTAAEKLTLEWREPVETDTRVSRHNGR